MVKAAATKSWCIVRDLSEMHFSTIMAVGGPDFSSTPNRVMSVAPVYLDGQKVVWSFDSDLGSTSAELTFGKDGILEGSVYYGSGRLAMVAKPVHPPVRVAAFLRDIFAIPHSVWAPYLNNSSRAVQIPIGFVPQGFASGPKDLFALLNP